jgi:predicted phosphodiesterase
MSKIHIRFIGDVHQNINSQGNWGRSYKKLISKVEYSVQVGDFGFSYHALEKIDPTKHKIVAGNHDNYEAIATSKYPHFLGDFGVHTIPLTPDDNGNPKDFSFFYIRGAFSVDKHLRRPYLSWWPEEELTFIQQQEAFKAYVDVKPQIVVSHDCPYKLVKFVATNDLKLNPSSTGRLLQACYDSHQPIVWIHGHHHKNWIKSLRLKNNSGNPTFFICLDELGYLDLDDKGAMMVSHPQ